MYFKAILFCIFSSCIIAKLPAQTKHALIVAIGNYPKPEENLWPVINSINDVPLIKNVLIKNQNFNEKNVQVVTDEKADKKGIIKTLENLIVNVNRGDIVVIHFSCHGQQIQDDGDDEIDGLDEAIVPYGAVFTRDETKIKELSNGYLRDDLFGDLITQLRNKLGKQGDVLVTLDACHSGSGTRGVSTAKVRGGNMPMVSSNFKPGNYSGTDNAGVFKESKVTKLNTDAATFELISGARAKELNSECNDDNDNPVGSLSYAISKALSSLNGKITYRGFFSQIENIMLDKAPDQKPVLEGDDLNRELFGGNYEKQQTYFSINSMLSSKEQVELNAGFVSGITVGSTINFFEAGTGNTTGKKPLGTGKVISNTSFTAIVKIDNPEIDLAKMNAWAFINEIAYGNEKIKLFIKGKKEMVKMLQDSLKDFNLVEFNSNCNLYLDTSVTMNNWALKFPVSGQIFKEGFSFNKNESFKPLKDALKSFDRFRYLKGLNINDPEINAQVQLVFLDGRGNIDSARLQSRTVLGKLELKEKDNVFLKIINTGNKDFYINIVDIQPNGIINAILPNSNLKNIHGNPAPIKWEDCLVEKGDTMLLRNYSITIAEPFGEETFKIFLSSSPLDLEEILTSNSEAEAAKKRGILNALEKIFAASNLNESGKRGAIATSINTQQNGTIFSLNFQIVPQ